MNSADMTIPPELAALQRYEFGFYQLIPNDRGDACLYDDVARAWHQRASGEAKPVAWSAIRQLPPAVAEHLGVSGQDVRTTRVQLHEPDGVHDIERIPLFTHPADTSALRECLRAEHLEHCVDCAYKPTDDCPYYSERARTLLAGDNRG